MEHWNTPGPSHQQKQVLTWVARGGGLLISAVWIFVLVSSTVQDRLQDVYHWTLEGSLLTVLVLACVVGLVFSFKDRVSGGKAVVISSLFLSIFSYFSAASNPWFAVACSGLPYFLVGFLLLQSASPREY